MTLPAPTPTTYDDTATAWAMRAHLAHRAALRLRDVAARDDHDAVAHELLGLVTFAAAHGHDADALAWARLAGPPCEHPTAADPARCGGAR